LLVGGAFLSAATAAVYCPSKFTPLEIVTILDDIMRLKQKNNPLCPPNPFSMNLAHDWKTSLETWANNAPSFSHASAFLALNTSGIVFHAQIEGLQHLSSISVMPMTPTSTHAIKQIVCPTATQTILLAAKEACVRMKSAGIANEEKVFSYNLIAAWKWLLDNKIGEYFPASAGPEEQRKWQAAVDQEEATWERENRPAKTIDASTSSTGGSSLSDRQNNILQAMWELKALDQSSRRSTEEIAVRAEGPNASPEGFKAAIADLQQRGLIDTKVGRGGGCWLLPRGIELIQNGVK